ncbi:hypothetical protein THAOC_21617 [Thalassiosira oceanica]|uniref:Uncharacterized protein n=1 Tax=Thalassiosira oceanica TaxID=159749 RepID=K0SIF3_THAOC|nr:hypothetical protein THAOC_21617 [Thalassiosira oceanica]|eukprot:EJK58277.1 hypothetical protein THAOC_21617 [Thalassiosira oceanica]
MRQRTRDPKASATISGNRGLVRGVFVDGLLRHPYAVESSLSYNMIEQTTRAEATSGPDGDDNGPGSEPPPLRNTPGQASVDRDAPLDLPVLFFSKEEKGTECFAPLLVRQRAGVQRNESFGVMELGAG